MTDLPVRPTVRDLPVSKIATISDYGREHTDLIPLWFGESDVPTPRFIQDAAVAAMRAGHMRYAAKRGIPELRHTLATYSDRLYGITLDPERIQVAPSGMNAIMLALQALVEPGRSVVCVTPLWPNAAAATQLLGGSVREVPLDVARDGERALDLDRLVAAIDDTTVAVFVNSPGNPTGWVLDPAPMRALLEHCRRRGVWVIADEVYARLTYDDSAAAPSFLEIADPEDRLIVVNSFSKTWCMTGWRLGWLTAPLALLPMLEKLNEFNTSGAADFTQRAGVVAVRDGEAFVAELRATCRANRDRVFERLSQLERVRIARPRAGFYSFFALDGEPDSERLARRVVDQAGVGLAPGAAFGAGGEGFLRLCFASAPATIERALDRLVMVFK